MKRPILATLVTAGFLACLALVSSSTRADDVEVSVTVVEGMTVNGDGSIIINASANPLVVTFPAVFNGVEYQISMVS